MRFVVNSNGEYYHIIEELQCPFNEKKDYIILKDGEIIYWRHSNNYYQDMTLNVEMMNYHIDEIEHTHYRSDIRKQKTLGFLRETLSKMIAYKRQIKINEVLSKIREEDIYDRTRIEYI
jgi:hypothetical protein